MGVVVLPSNGYPQLPEPPKSYIESLIPLALSPIKSYPPDDLVRELAYRMLKQRIALLKVVEHGGFVYFFGLQIKDGEVRDIVVFRVMPPDEGREGEKFRGWKYRTIRDLKEIPLEVLKAVLDTLLNSFTWRN